jgi:glycosyltransferase involved in cell wall biosynthesis
LPDKPEFVEALATKYPNYWNKIVQLPKLVSNFIASALYSTYLAKKLPTAVKATVERPTILKHFANQLVAITVPTKLMQKLFVKHGLDEQIIHHIPYGIDTAPLKKGQKKSASDELRIAFIGTLGEHKGPDLLIKAFLELPYAVKASLTLYGESKHFPEYCNYLHQLVDVSSVSEKITFAGTFPNSNIGEVFSKIDILVVPSRWYENTPLVIQSAFAAKTPIIAANLGGMSELVKHEFNGLLFEANNVKSLTDQLLRLITDQTLLPRLIDNIQPERTVADMVDQLEMVYAGICQSKHKV